MIDLAERRWTPTDAGDCMVCGCHERRHAAGGVCPHTVDSLTDEQVIDLWRRIAERGLCGTGVTLTDCLDASPLARSRANEAGLYYPAPTWAAARDARAKIVDVLNKERP